MTYNYKGEYKKWLRWKTKEEKVLRDLNVSESIIKELHDFDWQQFNSDRRFKRHQDITNDIYFLIAPYFDKKEINSIEDILDVIEYEAFYEYLKEQEPDVLNIILLRIQGYSVKEISSILNIPTSTIYHKIKEIKNFLTNFRK
ncbi:MAG: sigma-70 family RNA polymerase sigma factor [Erysipelotrichaceae bacterium]|nr:sigma-70 family RNA polymerase sigma factor [Erysipelotrichaceae bacterium]